MKYYLDTSIGVDLYENRKGYNQEPLGDFAWKLLSFIKAKEYKIILTDLLIIELESAYSLEQINGLFFPFTNLIEKIIIKKEQRDEAYKIAKKRMLPFGDALHSIIARDNNLILITRDKHFRELKDISLHYKPEDII